MSLRSRARRAAGDEQGALDDIEAAAKLWPGHPGLSRQLGAMLARRNEHGRAWAVYSEALDQGSDDRALWVEAARTLMALRREQEARVLLDRALKRDPRDANALINLALLLDAQGERQQALKLLDDALAAAPNNLMLRAMREQLEPSDKPRSSPLTNFPAFQGE